MTLGSATCLLLSICTKPHRAGRGEGKERPQVEITVMSSEEAGAEFEACAGCTYHKCEPLLIWKPAVHLNGATLGELLVLAGLLSVNTISFLQAFSGGLGLSRSMAAVILWLYAFLIIMLPLYVSEASWPQNQSSAYSSTIYLVQWFSGAINLRSALLDHGPRLASYTLLLNLGLETILVGLVLFSRPQQAAVPTSLEKQASAFSRLTFFWMDSMLLKGYTQGISIDMMRHLDQIDRAQSILASYRRLRKDAALSWNLASLFKESLVLQGTWAFVAGILTVAPALLLSLILSSLEEPGHYPKHVIWLLVILFPLIDLVKSIADGQALWQGHKLCLRARALLIGEVFRLTLHQRSVHAKVPTVPNTKSTQSTLGRLKKWVWTMLSTEEGAIALPISAPDVGLTDLDETQDDLNTDEPGVGNVVNLMSIDSYKVGDAMANLHLLTVQAPMQIIITIAMLYRILGWSAFSGLAMMLFMIPFNITLSKNLVRNQAKIMASTDRRIRAANDLFRNIRTVKFFVWENHFSTVVNGARSTEMKGLQSRIVLLAAASTAWYAVPALVTLLSLFCYTTLEGKPLRPSLAFASISMFKLLRVPLGNVGHVLAQVNEASVSLRRIEEFIGDAEDPLPPARTTMQNTTSSSVLGFQRAHFTWAKPGSATLGAPSSFALRDMDFRFHPAKLNVIVGPTGSGKSSLLLAMLGEMRLVEGDLMFSDTLSRAYVAQTPWIFHGTIRENILFSTPYDANRYHHTIEVCALDHDLHCLSAGDAMMTGESGITLSGGQKQRISLARAIYSHSQTVLLDDCLSALDPHTAQSIFENCIRELPRQGRTCVLVTHNTTLCVPVADFVVALDKGRVVAHGPPSQVLNAGVFPPAVHEVLEYEIAQKEQVPDLLETAPEVWQSQLPSPHESHHISSQAVNEMLDFQEHADTEDAGAMGWSTSKLYLAAMGTWRFWLVLVLVLAAEQAAGVASTLWIGGWSNESIVGGNTSDAGVQSTLHIHAMLHLTSQTRLGPSSPNVPYALMIASQGPQADSSGSSTSALYHVFVLAMISFSGIMLVMMRETWAAFGSLTASRKLHTRLLDVTTRSTFRFFDTTPLGQLMNRFSKDIEIIDQEMTLVIIYMFSLILDTTISIVIMAWVTPQLLIVGFLIVAIYSGIASFYLRSSRELKEHEARGRSPLFQQFGEVLAGLVTIRAYNNEQLFLENNAERIDTQSRPFFHLWAANRWLALRTEFLGNLLFVLTSVFVLLRHDINPGLAAASLTYAMSFSNNLIWLVRMYAVFEQNMNSVHRIRDTVNVELEADPDTARCHPSATWPSKGTVEFRRFSARYRPELDLCLREVSFRANQGERVGIVGRTGAGKSTLGLALFRALEAEAGVILIDGVDISQVSLERLRRSVTMVPQDPSLFAGTVRSNIDLLFEYSDAEVNEVLDRVQLSGAAQGAIHAAFPIDDAGANLSQGQRQLLCLARALLRRSRVLIVDEATASIDHSTDAQVQAVLGSLDATIVTVAHRLATVADHDRIIVLDRGTVIEQGPPWVLLRDPQGAFRGMCETSGELQSLVNIAECAQRGRSLIDLDS